jgi:hypothetical protein
MPRKPQRGIVIVLMTHNIGDMMSPKNGRDMEQEMVISCVLNLYLLGLVREGKNATFNMTAMQENSLWEVFVLILLTRENVKGVQIATLSTACRMKVRVILTRNKDLRMLALTGWCFIEVIFILT